MAADFPVAVYAQIRDAQKSGQKPDMNAMLPQLQAVTFKSAAVRFEDSSLTKRLLPMLAKMQGMDEATLIASAGAMMQMGLMQLQNQAFSEQATAAVNGFLPLDADQRVDADSGMDQSKVFKERPTKTNIRILFESQPSAESAE